MQIGVRLSLLHFTSILLGMQFEIVVGYKAVYLIHGIMTGDESMEQIRNTIIAQHPETVVYNCKQFGGWSSLDNMWHQVQEIGSDLMNVSSQHPDGIHLVGYSQGALLARAILETFPGHNVRTFVSLSGPQAGQYGSKSKKKNAWEYSIPSGRYAFPAAFLHIIFPGIALKSAFELFYSRIGQHTSVANYWNDPHHQELYYFYSQFLPYVNNEIITNRTNGFKEGLVKLEKFVLIGGPDDNVITPWQSSQFGYFDENMTVMNLENRDIFTKDAIGLKTLKQQGKLEVITVLGVNHFMWHLNVTIVEDYILPYLN